MLNNHIGQKLGNLQQKIPNFVHLLTNQGLNLTVIQYNLINFTYLFVKIPYVSSIKAIVRFSKRKKNRLREFASAKIILQNRNIQDYGQKSIFSTLSISKQSMSEVL